MVTLTQEHIKLPAPCFCAHSNCLVWTGVLQSEAKICSNIEGMVILPLSLSDCTLCGEPNIVPSLNRRRRRRALSYLSRGGRGA